MSNRNIAFRAWDRCKNKMTYKVLVGNTDIDDPNYTCTTVLGENGWVHDDGTCLALMQFTGLKDKHGTKIYEGDVAKVMLPMGGFWGNVKTEKIGAVEWAEEQCRFVVRWAWSKNQHHVDIDCDLDIEVIGNIYEHPELLA